MRKIRGKRGQGESGWVIAGIILALIVLVLVATGAGKAIWNLITNLWSRLTPINAPTIISACKQICMTSDGANLDYCCFRREVKFTEKGQAFKLTCADPRLASDCSDRITCGDFCSAYSCAEQGGTLKTTSCTAKETEISMFKEIAIEGDVTKTCAGQTPPGTLKETCLDTEKNIAASDVNTATDDKDTEGNEIKTNNKCCVLIASLGKKCCI